jgi:cobalt-zinc-cadmium efflux system outer membrane protein
MVGRIFFAALVVLSSASGVARAQVLTEGEVIRLAKARDPGALAAREASAVAHAEEIRASLYPNPSLTWDRERVPAAGGTRLDDLFVSLPLDLTGRRWANTALARANVANARATAALTQTEAVILSLEAFADVLAGARNAEIAARVVARLDEAARVVRRREEEGTTSGYERTRLEVEAELANSALAQARTRERIARAELGLLLGIELAKLEVAGELATADPGVLTDSAVTRPSIRMLRSSEESTQRARDAAAWAWLPTFSVMGGLRIDDTTSSRLYGHVAGLSLSLPIFSNGQDVRAEASARHRLALAELRAAERGARIEAGSAHQQLVAAREELARFSEATRERVVRLERAAESGYREGARSIVELVDAQRVRTEVERRRLELEVVAKRAEVALRAARGEFE